MDFKKWIWVISLLVLISCKFSSDSNKDGPECKWNGGLYKIWLSSEPSKKNQVVVILHQGHTPFDYPDTSLIPVALKLQEEGFDVYGFEMPPVPHGPPIEKFYNPVLDMVDTLPEDNFIFMIGLSGGGWTTTVVTAFSERIVRGYSVAGDIPLDMRIRSSDYGDWEQRNPPLPYRELYDIAGQRLLHIYNYKDDCCFGYNGWTEEELGTSFLVDYTNYRHSISEWTTEYIIEDILNQLETKAEEN